MAEPIVKKPLECSQDEVSSFQKLAEKSGEVQMKTLPGLIRDAEYLAFYYGESSTLLAIGALKNPRPEYRSKVFKSSGSDLQPMNYKFELGWLYTRPEDRGNGIGQMILSALLSKAVGHRVYATTRRPDAKHILEKFHFTQSGEPYKSSRGDYSLYLLVTK